MKQFKMYFLAAIICCMVAACNINVITPEDEEPQQPKVTYIRADANENATKASIDGTDASFYWNAGDQIVVNTNSGYKVSDVLTTFDGATATFSFSGENAFDDADRTNYAFYPYTIVSGTTVPTITLPASYTLAQVTGEVTPCPMIAVNSPGTTLAFKQLCALLRITVNNIPPHTSYLKVDFGNKQVQGVFTLGEDAQGNKIIETSTAAGNSIVTITGLDANSWTDNLVISIPVPVGTYQSLKVSAYAGTGSDPVLSVVRQIKVSSGKWEANRLAARKISASLPAFSVSNGSRVTIAKTNLRIWKKDEGDEYSFNENPYDCTNYDNWETPWTPRNRDLLTWGEVNAYTDSYWRIPSESDWAGIIGRSGTPYIFVYLKGQNNLGGLFILPDNWDFSIAGKTISSGDVVSNNDYTRLIYAGAVFLPAAGMYYGSSTSGDYGQNGYYWSSTSNDTNNASELFFSRSAYDLDGQFKDYYLSVRPIHTL